jgi:outer membrane protein OmpA-like peptidoglycan-associated protein
VNKGLNTRAAWCAILAIAVIAITTGCASKAQRSELRLESEAVVLPPIIRQVDVKRNGATVLNGAEVAPGDQITIEIRGTRGVEGVVSAPTGAMRLQDSGDGKYVANAAVPAGATSFDFETWLTDGAATPPDSDRMRYRFPVRQPATDVVPAWKRAQADLDNVGRLPFEHDSATVGNGGSGVLDAWAKIIADYPDVNFAVYGACSQLGDDRYNNVLGLRRAIATKTALIERGAEGARVAVSSLGRQESHDCLQFEGDQKARCLAQDRWTRVVALP